MTTTPVSQSSKGMVKQFIPVMLCFFAMGFVDLVGCATNYVKEANNLSASVAGFLGTMVFFWFLIFSVPSGMLMNKIGRKNTVLISLVITAVSLILPLFGEGLALMIISFCLLGIGNSIMQTSLNPLVSNLISPDKLASTLTFGQFVKAIASFLAPIIATWGAAAAIHFGGWQLGWRVLFAIYALVSIISILALSATPIQEEKPDKVSGFAECIKLLGVPFIFLCFLSIFCHVGIDVGTNIYAPQILMDRLGITLEDAAFATSWYFIFRTLGCFLGSFILRVMRAKWFFLISVLMMLAAVVLLFISANSAVIYTAIALIGFGNSNIFSIVFSQALIAQPHERNEVSGLMIMGLIGGAIFPPVMGYLQEGMGISAAIAVLAAGVIYLLFFTLKIKKA